VRFVEKIFKALSCSWRIEILRLLKNGEACQCEIIKQIPLDATTLSRHIKILKEASLILERREGTKKLLRLRDKRILDILKIAEELSKQ